MSTIKDAAFFLREKYFIPDVVRKFAHHVQLHANGAELCSPCPRCGGRDRFYITADGKGCACRQCHTQRMDATGFLAWLLDVPMHEAVDILTQRKGTPASETAHAEKEAVTRPNVTVTPSQPVTWRTDAARRVQQAHERLFGDTQTAAAARDYLLSRGLTPATWTAFSLGYDRTRVPDTNLWRPAICWPVTHETTGETVGVRYRFLETQQANGKPLRYTYSYGSVVRGHLFGAGLLWADRTACLRCLLLCEGEFNSMAVYQSCHCAGVDVLSFGSESQRTLPAWAVELASNYGAVLAWVDDAGKSAEVARQLPQAVTLRSIVTDGVKQDANALLVAGTLGGLIQTARLRALRDDTQRESLSWQLWDSWRDGTLDAGQVKVGRQLAQALGYSASWQEA